ncbi:hypothetical protein FBR02_07890 [Anaerolineae bacterium CFX9]|nr:hypothetical protein [Anaerolineae bacterium CFX9]
MVTSSSPPLTGDEARRAARNAGALAAARILSSAALFIWQLILGRWLGAAEFGVYGTVGALFGVGASLAGFGMSVIVIREVARQRARAGEYLGATLFYQTLLALLAFIGVTVAALALGYDAQIRGLLAIAALSLFVDTLGNMAYDQLLAAERMTSASAVEVAHILLRIAVAGLALSLGWGLIGVYVVTIGMSLARAGAFWVLVNRMGVRPQFPIDRALARSLFINSAPLALSAAINLAYVQIDKLMSTSLLTTTDTGHLNAAFVIVIGVIEILSTTILIAVFPIMSRAYSADGDNALFYLLMEKLAYFTLIISVPLALAFALFADAITIPLFGVDFAPAADLLRALMIYASITMIVNVFAQGMYARNRQRHFVTIRAAGLGFKLLLNLILLPVVGVIGAALASLLAESLVLALAARDYPLQWRRIGRGVLRVGAAGAGCALIMFAFGSLLPYLGIVAGLLAYPLLIMAARALAQDDRDLLYRLIEAMPMGGRMLRLLRRPAR